MEKKYNFVYKTTNLINEKTWNELGWGFEAK